MPAKKNKAIVPFKNEINLLVGVPGSGKSTLAKKLVKGKGKVKLSRDEFRHMLTDLWYPGEEIEHLVSSLIDNATRSALASGYDVILEIDWQGAAQVREIYPDSIGIFILPPSVETLAFRLNNRGQDTTEVINKRVAAAREEMSHVVEFDYVTINDNFDVALQDLMAIIRTCRLETQSQLQRYAALVKQLT